MSYSPDPDMRPSPSAESNGMGIAGFVVSLVGIVGTCGLLSPIGLILSAMGMRREPRGLATAGLVLGIIGSLWFIVYGLTCVAGVVGLAAVAQTGAPIAQTAITLAEAQSALAQHQFENGTLPAPDEWPAILNRAGVSTKDAWGNELRFSASPGGAIMVRSAGPDGRFDTGDDL